MVDYSIIYLAPYPINQKYLRVASTKARTTFGNKFILLYRKSNQHVYIAGDRTGKAKWAVDDVLIK